MTVEAIKEAVVLLSSPERHELAEWLDGIENDDWDRQMEKDFSPGGRGEHLLDKIKNQVRAGNFTPLEKGFRLSQAPQPASK